MEEDEVGRAASALRRATMLLFASGAGMSADSGLPLYRCGRRSGGEAQRGGRP